MSRYPAYYVEMNALKKIKQILDEFDEYAAIRAAFDGVFEIAIDNITFGSADSVRRYVNYYREAHEKVDGKEGNNMISTKEQERKALEKIKKIVDELGENSYIKTAFTGAFKLAEDNIEDDAANSAQWYIDGYYKTLGELSEVRKQFEFQRKNYDLRITTLQAELDKELDWKPHEIKENVPQKDYDELFADSSTEKLSDEGAKEIISIWFGFSEKKIRIIREVPIWQINKHGRMRQVGKAERVPLHNATDWNYIRFDVCGRQYELYNDELRPFFD